MKLYHLIIIRIFFPVGQNCLLTNILAGTVGVEPPKHLDDCSDHPDNLSRICLEYPWEWGSPRLPSPKWRSSLIPYESEHSVQVDSWCWLNSTDVFILPTCSEFLPYSSCLAGSILFNIELLSPWILLLLPFLFVSLLLKCQRQSQRHVCLKLLPPMPTSLGTKMLLCNVPLYKPYLLFLNVGATSGWEGFPKICGLSFHWPSCDHLQHCRGSEWVDSRWATLACRLFGTENNQGPKTQKETFPSHHPKEFRERTCSRKRASTSIFDIEYKPGRNLAESVKIPLSHFLWVASKCLFTEHVIFLIFLQIVFLSFPLKTQACTLFSLV